MQTPCPACNGTGQQPEAPAPAAPADLAAKLNAAADEHSGTELGYILAEAAEQLQRQAAALTTARGVIMAAIPTMCEAVGDWHIDDVLAKIDTALGEQQ